jgi:hypothetical protein
MPNPFRVSFSFIDSDPGLSLRSNPGLQLANAFGVFVRALGVLFQPSAYFQRSAYLFER